jgi:SAM-dependent methyltransferase
MNSKTISILNAVNRDFYHRQADAFSATRRAPWKGWQRLIQLIEQQFQSAQETCLLDVGCGNGRFGRFFAEHYSRPFSYFGVDASPRALEHAHTALSNQGAITLFQHDVVSEKAEEILPSEAHRPFSLVVAFGLLHHVPGRQLRQALMAELARRVDYQGILAISIWQFARFKRFRKKVIPWEDFEERTGIAVDPSELETGDSILTWGADPPAYRYCHFMSSEEASGLFDSLPLDWIETYTADGATGDLNRYYLMMKAR